MLLLSLCCSAFPLISWLQSEALKVGLGMEIKWQFRSLPFSDPLFLSSYFLRPPLAAAAIFIFRDDVSLSV